MCHSMLYKTPLSSNKLTDKTLKLSTSITQQIASLFFTQNGDNLTEGWQKGAEW